MSYGIKYFIENTVRIRCVLSSSLRFLKIVVFCGNLYFLCSTFLNFKLFKVIHNIFCMEVYYFNKIDIYWLFCRYFHFEVTWKIFNYYCVLRVFFIHSFSMPAFLLRTTTAQENFCEAKLCWCRFRVESKLILCR